MDTTYRVVLAFAVIVCAAAALAGEGPTTQPAVGQRLRAPISGERREALGLSAAPRGGEKVQEEVYRTLRIVEENFAKEFLVLPDRVFVQVLLKHDQHDEASSEQNRAAIKRVQDAVLGNLTAGDFAVNFRFTASPGLLGFASRQGFVKLAANPDMVVVALDDQPVEYPPHVTPEDLPSSTSPPTAQYSKVEEAVSRALEQHERVFVAIILARNPPGQLRRAARDSVLSAVSANEFWLTADLSTRDPQSVYGFINKEGLRKLSDHAGVIRIRLDRRAKPAIMKPSR